MFSKSHESRSVTVCLGDGIIARCQLVLFFSALAPDWLSAPTHFFRPITGHLFRAFEGSQS